MDTNNNENWRVFRNNRAILNKNIKNKKKEYLKYKLTEKIITGSLKKFNKQEKGAPPNNILYNGKNITSPSELAEIANDFFY